MDVMEFDELCALQDSFMQIAQRNLREDGMVHPFTFFITPSGLHQRDTADVWGWLSTMYAAQPGGKHLAEVLREIPVADRPQVVARFLDATDQDAKDVVSAGTTQVARQLGAYAIVRIEEAWIKRIEAPETGTASVQRHPSLRNDPGREEAILVTLEVVGRFRMCCMRFRRDVPDTGTVVECSPVETQVAALPGEEFSGRFVALLPQNMLLGGTPHGHA